MELEALKNTWRLFLKEADFYDNLIIFKELNSEIQKLDNKLKPEEQLKLTTDEYFWACLHKEMFEGILTMLSLDYVERPGFTIVKIPREYYSTLTDLIFLLTKNLADKIIFNHIEITLDNLHENYLVLDTFKYWYCYKIQYNNRIIEIIPVFM